MDVVTPSRT